ncbi:MAG: hypothetical protein JZU58_28405 [Curvibacter lanceolatus]|uniref:hypothetical protein n=1 Tax=Curvibacter lanceolatus TaxID=86182 RepID=UPI0023577CA8|nr:hypothetical protein [Curvibacter lanceolatus]MBV5296280.1 hypothetical protein [Curvibacter lanceolatus]
MTYSETLTLTVAASLAVQASAIGRAMDPDTGGADSFRHPVTGYAEDGAPVLDQATLTTTTACTPEFKAQALAMLADPELLFAACQADYAARWPGLVSPSLEDCTAFCEALQID